MAQTPENLVDATEEQKTAAGVDPAQKVQIYTKAAGTSADGEGPAAVYISNELGYDYITFDFYFAAFNDAVDGAFLGYKPYMAMKAYRTMSGNYEDGVQDANSLELTIVDKATGLAPDVTNQYTGTLTWGSVEANTWYTMTCKVTDWAKLNLILWGNTSATVYFTNIKGQNG